MQVLIVEFYFCDGERCLLTHLLKLFYRTRVVFIELHVKYSVDLNKFA